MQLKSMAAVALASGIVSSSMAADAVQWRVADGGNGHWYEIRSDGGSWTSARASCDAAGGHLATVGNAAENAFIWNALGSSGFYPCHAMLGGYQDPRVDDYSEPSGGWRWVTGEPMTYTAWYAGEPNNGAGGRSESFIAFREFNCDGTWNDIPDEYSSSDAYVVEWSADCNNDGIVDYGQILGGSLPDSNANGVPDACDPLPQFEVVRSAPDPVIVTNHSVRSAIAATGYPWKVRDLRSGVEFLLVPPGTFIMGSSVEDSEATADEQPAHQVTLTRPFYIGRTEVTQAQWASMTGTSPSYFSGQPSNPVERVSWNMSVATATAFGYRLPTEAEWEYACRGGLAMARYGPINEIAWWGNGFGGSSGWGTNPVGTKAANGFGLHDMIGNVWEHCQDFFAPYSAASQVDPTGPASGALRVGRSGDWYWPAVGNRAPYRLGGDAADVGLASTGVRFALSPESTGLFDASTIPDCNSDGIADYPQCRDGSLPDFNGNYIPDCCEQGTACIPGSNPVEWRSADGGNGHWYQARRFRALPDTRRLQEVAASDLGAFVATIESAAENVHVTAMLQSIEAGEAFGVWIGLYRAFPGSTWQWTDGGSLDWSGWGGSECASGPYPNDLDWPGELGTMIYRQNCGLVWDDTPMSWISSPPNWWVSSSNMRLLVEWSADCNSDGIVDYGQILRGELSDADADGVPDLCESTILVPSQFPTIQAAIDSVPAGAQRTVQVAAGTYNESFSLNGKNVVIRGAANNATILDGTGLPASIATFTGGEPATAGLESLVFRNATVGSLIYKGALFKVGGAVYGRDSSAVIRNCRFEGNRSDYGGGAYLLYCNMLVESCVFTGNTGVAQGGGLMVFGTTGTVRNCTFTGNQCGIAGVGGGSAFKAAGALLTGESVNFDGCTVTGNTAGVEGGAVEYYENVELNPGTLHIVNSAITGNRSGLGALAGAGGLLVTGRMQSAVVHGGTTICDNLPRNIEGPYFIEGAPTICDCMADLSGDGAVNGGDLGLLLNAWGGTLPTGAGDVNHDGIVDGVDLAELLGNWGACN